MGRGTSAALIASAPEMCEVTFVKQRQHRIDIRVIGSQEVCKCLGRWNAVAFVGVERAALAPGYALRELNFIPCVPGASKFVCSVNYPRAWNSLYELMGFGKPAMYIPLQILKLRMRRCRPTDSRALMQVRVIPCAIRLPFSASYKFMTLSRYFWHCLDGTSLLVSDTGAESDSRGIHLLFGRPWGNRTWCFVKSTVCARESCPRHVASNFPSTAA